MNFVNKPCVALKIDGFQANLVHEIDIKRTKGYNLPTHGGNGSGSRGRVTPPNTPKKQKALIREGNVDGLLEYLVIVQVDKGY